jgi:hypothetical protein
VGFPLVTKQVVGSHSSITLEIFWGGLLATLVKRKSIRENGLLKKESNGESVIGTLPLYNKIG